MSNDAQIILGICIPVIMILGGVIWRNTVTQKQLSDAILAFNDKISTLNGRILELGAQLEARDLLCNERHK